MVVTIEPIVVAESVVVAEPSSPPSPHPVTTRAVSARPGQDFTRTDRRSTVEGSVPFARTREPIGRGQLVVVVSFGAGCASTATVAS